MNNAHKIHENILLNKSVIICSVLYDIMIIDHFIVCKHFTPQIIYTHTLSNTDNIVSVVEWPKIKCKCVLYTPQVYSVDLFLFWINNLNFGVD